MSVFVDKNRSIFKRHARLWLCQRPIYGEFQSMHKYAQKREKMPCSEEKAKKHYICGVMPEPRLRRVHGEMAEWSIAAVLKTVVRATGPGVRIPLSPQSKSLPSVL